ncbi:MAG: hypothetical protein GY906_18500 [bacterium]|nr:hypothetical protein [bacterium]
MIRRLLALAIGVTVGCTPAPALEESVRLVYQHPMVSLDPHAHNDGVTGAVLSGVYEGLVTLSFGTGVEPGLAERWSTPTDTTWQFRIREGVRFHDGSELFVDDVVESIRRARFGSSSTLATYMLDLEDVRVVEEEERMVEVTTSAPFPLLLTRLAMVAIVPSVFDSTHPIGTGPFLWQSGTVAGPVTLQRWDDYWGASPAADQVVIRFVENEADLLDLMERDEVDVMARITGEFLHRNPVEHSWQVVSNPSVETTILGLNASQWPLSDRRVRLAIDLAIDRQTILQTAGIEEFAEPAWQLVPPGVFGYAPDADRHSPDISQGKALLSEAGVPPGTPLRIDFSTTNIEAESALTDALEELGFEVVPEVLPYQKYYDRLRAGDTELYVFGWNFSQLHASEFLDAVIHSRDPGQRHGKLNGAMFSDAKIDTWIETAAREADSKEQFLLLRRSLERVAEERPYLPLYHRSRLTLTRDSFVVASHSVRWVSPQDIRFVSAP